MKIDTPTLVPLADATDRTRFGSKAANLAHLIAGGFDVPDALVIPGDVERRADVEALARRAAESLTGPLAIRSSGVAEDLPDASFAGQYETVLGVEGATAIVAAVSQCRASVRGHRAASYATGLAVETAPLAVIIQSLVPANAAGVAFSINPVTGADEVVIEAAEGLGDRVVAGEIVPESWTVAGVPSAPAGASVLDTGQASRIAATVRRIAAYLGGPQDVEWAIAGDRLWILHARPITAVPVEPTIDLPARQTWIRQDEYYPSAVKPLEYEAWLPALDAAFAGILADLGLPIAGIVHRLVAGRVYWRISPVGDRGRDGTPPPAAVFGLLLRVVPALRRRMKLAAAAERSDLPMALVAAWESGGCQRLRDRRKQLRAVDRAALDDRALADHLEAVLAHVERSVDDHIRLTTGSMFIAAGRLGVFLEERLGWTAIDTIGLAQRPQDSGYEAALANVLAAVRAVPALATRVESDPGVLLHDPGAAGQALRAFLEEFGHAMVGVDLAHPTYAEDPTPVLAVLQQRLRGERQESVDSAGSAARLAARARASLASPDLARFERLLSDARTAVPYGEDTERDVVESLALVRYAATEAATRLAAAGVIAHVQDIHFLVPAEIAEALRTGRTDADVARRVGEHRWSLANPGPRIRGPEPAGPPDLRHAPRAAQPILSAFQWSMEHLFPRPPEQPDGDALVGVAASPGRATGTVRVIDSPAQFDRITAGDVLVCPSTMASWSVVFGLIAAVVTEYGGPLSHPAILAREYGVPAVVSVPGVTGLQDGLRATVDGAAGTVTVHRA